MKVPLFFILTIAILATFAEAQSIFNLLKDERYVQKQIDCILNRGRCDVVGKKIKGLLPEALNNNCQRCTPRQMAQTRILIDFMQHNYPDEWHLIVQRYSHYI